MKPDYRACEMERQTGSGECCFGLARNFRALLDSLWRLLHDVEQRRQPFRQMATDIS